jgi:hypothetical protein
LSTNDNPTPGDEWVLPPEEPATPEDKAPRPARRRTAAKLSALVAASVVVGAGASYVVNHGSEPTASAGTASSPAAVGRSDAGPPAGFDGSGGGGGIAGEQHVQGAVTAKTDSTVTVRSSGGTATYSVVSTSQIVRDGQPATLADVKVGDAVLVHVYPSSGRMLVERLFAGTLAGGGFGPPDAGGSTT